MKKIIPFLIVLGALAVGVVYYTGGEQTTSNEVKHTLPSQVQVRNPAWSGTIVNLGQGRAQRKLSSDAGDLQNITADSFEIVWDKWDIEVYKKNTKTGIYHLVDKRKKPATK